MQVAIPFPVVGTIEHAFTYAAEAVSFAERCNVIVTTVAALSKVASQRSMARTCRRW